MVGTLVMQHLAVDQADLEALANGEVPEVLRACARVVALLNAREAAHSTSPDPPAGGVLCGASPIPRHLPPARSVPGPGRGPTLDEEGYDVHGRRHWFHGESSEGFEA